LIVGDILWAIVEVSFKAPMASGTMTLLLIRKDIVATLATLIRSWQGHGLKILRP
jgi:hypothetical protein